MGSICCIRLLFNGRINNYIKHLGFTPQNPIKRVYQQNPRTVKEWRKYDYPNIFKKAKFEKVKINWVDETDIRSDFNCWRSFSLKGKTPVIEINGKKIKINLIS